MPRPKGSKNKQPINKNTNTNTQNVHIHYEKSTPTKRRRRQTESNKPKIVKNDGSIPPNSAGAYNRRLGTNPPLLPIINNNMQPDAATSLIHHYLTTKILNEMNNEQSSVTYTALKSLDAQATSHVKQPLAVGPTGGVYPHVEERQIRNDIATPPQQTIQETKPVIQKTSTQQEHKPVVETKTTIPPPPPPPPKKSEVSSNNKPTLTGYYAVLHELKNAASEEGKQERARKKAEKEAAAKKKAEEKEAARLSMADTPAKEPSSASLLDFLYNAGTPAKKVSKKPITPENKVFVEKQHEQAKKGINQFNAANTIKNNFKMHKARQDMAKAIDKKEEEVARLEHIINRNKEHVNKMLPETLRREKKKLQDKKSDKRYNLLPDELRRLDQMIGHYNEVIMKKKPGPKPVGYDVVGELL